MGKEGKDMNIVICHFDGQVNKKIGRIKYIYVLYRNCAYLYSQFYVIMYIS